MSEVRTLRPERDILHSVTAEQQILGTIMLNNEVFDLVSDILSVEHFFDPVHARIFELCCNRITKGHLASPVALGPIMEGEPGLKELGGPGYLIRLAGASISAKLARDYAKVIVEHACRRRLNEAAQEAVSAISAGAEAQEVKAGLLARLHALPEASGEESTASLLKAVTGAVDGAVKSYQGGQTFLKTGVAPLDAVLKGLAPGDLMILGGSTSMGKTSLALEIAKNVACDQGKGVAFVSLEMQKEELATRMISANARVPYSDIRDAASMEEADFRKWVEASQAIASAPLRIIPKQVRDIPAIHAAVRRAGRELGEAGLSLVVVDYAQLVRGTGKGRYEQMTEVSIGLKTLAGMLSVPVIALVQLSRDIGNREDKRPQLNDIKETGQFENDADQVVFCHREAYWLERRGPQPNGKGEITETAKTEWQADLAAVRNVMEIIVRKNRHGRLATAQVGFHPPTNRFWQLGQRDDVQEEF